jgi:Spy/CpxP family protein refolding chaperone
MTFQHTFRGIAGVAAVAMAMAFGSGAALAQPLGVPHGHGGHGGPGGPGGGDAMIGHLIAEAKAELKLNTMQQEMFDRAIANSKLAREKARARHSQVRGTLQAELAKPEPNLGAAAAAADAAMEEGRLARKAIRDEWLALYEKLGPEQKAVVRDRLQKRMSEGESFRQRMRERMHQFREGAAG